MSFYPMELTPPFKLISHHLEPKGQVIQICCAAGVPRARFVLDTLYNVSDVILRYEDGPYKFKKYFIKCSQFVCIIFNVEYELTNFFPEDRVTSKMNKNKLTSLVDTTKVSKKIPRTLKMIEGIFFVASSLCILFCYCLLA